MTIKSQLSYGGKIYSVEYKEEDPDLNMDGIILNAVHAFCFYGDKMVAVYNHSKNAWTPPGGSVEVGETWAEAAIREVREETNMQVVHMECLGYQDISGDGRKIRQVRTFCIVEQKAEVAKDSDSDILEIKLIDPKDAKKYFDWGEIGDRLLSESIKRRESTLKKT